MDYFKNPIVLGLITCTLSFLYLKWKEYKSIQNNEEPEPVSMTYPILIGLVVFIGMIIWGGSKKTVILENIPIKIPEDIITLSLPAPVIDTMHTGILGESLPKIFIETH